MEYFIIKQLEKWRKYLFLLMDRLITLRKTKSENNILLLIKPDAIGDFIIWLDSAKEYRSIYPNRKIILIGNKQWRDLAEDMPYWDEFWALDFKKLINYPLFRFRFLMKVRKLSPSVAIYSSISRTLLKGDSLIRASGAFERIGSEGDAKNSSAKDLMITNQWYTRLLPLGTAVETELEANANFISQLTGHKYIAHAPQLIVPPIEKKLKPLGDYFIIFPGASRKGKQWNPENFAKVIAAVVNKNGWQPILCGSKSEYILCENVKSLTHVSCVNFAGKTSLVELAQLIRESKLLIANDTSATHVAVAVNTPSVCIVGGGHFGHFIPYPKNIEGVKPLVAFHEMPCFNCNWLCVRQNDRMGRLDSFPCVDAVTVEQVMKLIV